MTFSEPCYSSQALTLLSSTGTNATSTTLLALTTSFPYPRMLHRPVYHPLAKPHKTWMLTQEAHTNLDLNVFLYSSHQLHRGCQKYCLDQGFTGDKGIMDLPKLRSQRHRGDGAQHHVCFAASCKVLSQIQIARDLQALPFG